MQASPDAPPPGTVEHYKLHEACQRRINALTTLLDEVVEECEDREDASIEADGSATPNVWMRLHLRIREVVRR